MKQSESIANLAAALVAASAEIKSVPKDATNPHFKNRYATLDAISESVRPVLAKHGLAVMQGTTLPETNEGVIVGFSLETLLLHKSGEWLSNAVIIPIEKASAQGAGSAITYGRRYGLSALLGITTDEDDDGTTAQNHAPRATATASRPASAPASRPAPPAVNGGAAVMPFGKTKGTPLALLKDEEIESALKWAQEKGKFTEFQAEAAAELASRVGAGVGAEMDGRMDEEDELPF